MKSSDEHLQQGIAAYKHGQKQEAGRLIKLAVQQNPKNEKAWLWLSGFVETADQRRTCLERVLAINPGNKLAQQGLEELSAERGRVNRPSPPEPLSLAPAAAVNIEPPASYSAEPALPQFSAAIPAAPELELAGPLPAQGKENGPRKLRIPLVISLILLILISLVFVGATLAGIPIPKFNSPAIVSAQNISPEIEHIITEAIYENIAANNAENIERYMATIHSQSGDFDSTREKIETLYQDYDLIATITYIEIIRYSQTEARVNFTLETRKLGGPDFRDNRINGVFILRPENGRWKFYDQIVNKIQYFEYVE